jgi:predicted metalloendopeptidase
MVNDIRTAFTEIVMELDWMDAETKERTLEKAHAIRPFIGFPGWLLTPGELEKYYEGVSSCALCHQLLCASSCVYTNTTAACFRQK